MNKQPLKIGDLTVYHPERLDPEFLKAMKEAEIKTYQIKHRCNHAVIGLMTHQTIIKAKSLTSAKRQATIWGQQFVDNHSSKKIKHWYQHDDAPNVFLKAYMGNTVGIHYLLLQEI